MTFPHGRNGLNARQMAVLSTFREPALCRYVHRELLRSALPGLTPIISATACYQRNYVERYSRSTLQPTVDLKPIHNRMPVMLEPEAEGWLFSITVPPLFHDRMPTQHASRWP